jgi:FkbM family methyltransferase
MGARSALQILGRPQYLFRPSQAAKRILRVVRGTKPQETVTLPWGLDIVVDTADTVGSAIALQGAYDLVTTEVLWRLTAPGDKTIDVGAHVGYMSSVLAHRAGPSGSVLAFEPVPENFEGLKNNVQRWAAAPSVAPITLRNVALSNHRGRETMLDVPTHRQNKCWMHLPGWNHQPEALRPGVTVDVRRLDEFIGSEVGVIKLDVEYHEAQVLEGAGKLLNNVRDIVFEETAPYPQQSHKLLERAGFRILWFEQRISGPRMVNPASAPRQRPYDTMPSYLATKNYERAEGLLSKPGWQCLTYKN